MQNRSNSRKAPQAVNTASLVDAVSQTLSGPYGSLSSQLKNSQAQKVLTVTERLQAELLPVLTLYYPLFAAQYCGNDQQTKAVMAQFAERLIVEGIGQKRLTYGIERLKKLAGSEKFSPNPQAFAEMCKPAGSDLQLPTFEQVLADVILARRRGRNQPFVFKHELTRLINHRVGFELYNLTSEQFRKLVKSEYDALSPLALTGKLPEPRMAIAHDQQPELPEYMRGLKSPRIEAMRAEAAALRQAQAGASEGFKFVHKA